MGFSRQECWSRLPFPSPGDLPDPGIEPWSPALQADTLPSKPPGESQEERIMLLNGYLAMFGDIFNCQVWESATKIRNAAKHLNNAQDKPLQQRNIVSKMSIMPRLRNPGLV